MDEADLAQDCLERAMAAAERRRARPLTVADSALICIDCEEPIPERRRTAAPGCTRCIECQTLHENWRPL
jgi:phage/conjugal plasmid C-4 type zinc finger TraR family protein